jgi:uncharacterized protein
MSDETSSTIAAPSCIDHQLDRRVIRFDQVAGWLSTAVVGVGSLTVLLITWIANGPTWRGLLIRVVLWMTGVGLLTWQAHRWPSISYRHASYRVDDRTIEIRRGVYWRAVITVPRSRVQHTDVSQGPLERSFGLGTLVIYTAGTEHARVSLSGLEHTRALRIREHLLPTEGGDAV